jgi:flavorubredoxin
MKGLKFRSKKAAAFGCYGWSGESVKVIRAQLEAAGFQVVDDGQRCLWNPDAKSIESCVEYGGKLAGLLK